MFSGSEFLTCLYAFVGSVGFCVLFHLRGKEIIFTSLGGAAGWLASLLALPVVGSEVMAYFVAALVLSVYSETMARVRKCPVTVYLLIAIFPLVPGAGIYVTMQHALRGENTLFLSEMMHTLSLSGALALGILLVSSAIRMWRVFRRRVHLNSGR